MKKALILLAVSCLCLTLAAEGPQPVARPGFEIHQPQFLSATSENTLWYTLLSPVSGEATLSVRLLTDDELLDEEVLRQSVSVFTGQRSYTFLLPPQALSRVNHGEDVTLAAALSLPDGRVLEADADATVIAGPAPEGGSWGITLATKPALIYTSRDTVLNYTVTNPKANSKKVGLYLKFMNDKKKKKVVYQTIEYPQPGVSTIPVIVPSSVATQARSKGDTILKTVLKVEGLVKKRDQALLDFDFMATASADPVVGDAPLLVRFTGDATGGKIPYAYNWVFGDGGTSSEQNPVHNYTAAGTYDVTLAVSDSLGATVGATTQVTVNVPPLSVTCGASTYQGTAPLAVNFTCTAEGGVGSYSYSWNFGDGGTSTQQNPSHTYTTGGTSYAATVTVTSGSATKTCTTQSITVEWPTLVVTCAASPKSGTVPLTVQFTSLASGGSGTYTYDWDWGDGATHGNTQNPSHTYTTAGTYAPKVTVTSGGQAKTCSEIGNISVTTP